MSVFVRRVLPPILVGVVALIGWELTVRLGRVAPYILPAPSAIWHELVAQRDNVWAAALASGANALIGLIAGSALGVLAAMVASRVRVLSEVSVPFAAVLNALPIIALAPILNNMFESTSSVPRRIVTAIIAFFPVFVNTLRGLREVDPVHRELMDSYAASSWTFARKVRLPGALPFVFTGARIAMAFAWGSIIAAELAIGIKVQTARRAVAGIGQLMVDTLYVRRDVDALVLYMIVIGIVSFLIDSGLRRAQARLMPWTQR